jgi:hypothetical protein
VKPLLLLQNRLVRKIAVHPAATTPTYRLILLLASHLSTAIVRFQPQRRIIFPVREGGERVNARVMMIDSQGALFSLPLIGPTVLIPHIILDFY